jgi:methionyl-tRNA formyltransferase
MNVAWLGPQSNELERYVASLGDSVRQTEEKVTPESEIIRWADYIVSYGYRHIISKSVLVRFPRRAVNLHISYLPWNRGADPNMWSFLEDTPKGVTIHYLDEGLDTGDILAQIMVPYRQDDTLRTSYERLKAAIEALFVDTWPDIRAGRQPSMPQPPGGSCHRGRDRAAIEHLLTQGWETPVADVIGKALVSRP